jgi:hypothetical protein
MHLVQICRLGQVLHSPPIPRAILLPGARSSNIPLTG